MSLTSIPISRNSLVTANEGNHRCGWIRNCVAVGCQTQTTQTDTDSKVLLYLYNHRVTVRMRYHDFSPHPRPACRAWVTCWTGTLSGTGTLTELAWPRHFSSSSVTTYGADFLKVNFLVRPKFLWESFAQTK